MSVELPFHCLSDEQGEPEHLILFFKGRERLACECGKNIVARKRIMRKISEAHFSCKECERKAMGIRDFWISRESADFQRGMNGE
jgi:hypothetical protein